MELQGLGFRLKGSGCGVLVHLLHLNMWRGASTHASKRTAQMEYSAGRPTSPALAFSLPSQANWTRSQICGSPAFDGDFFSKVFSAGSGRQQRVWSSGLRLSAFGFHPTSGVRRDGQDDTIRTRAIPNLQLQ